MKNKINKGYFDKEYWTKGTKSGYKAGEYTMNDYMNKAKTVFLKEVYPFRGNWLEAGCAFGWVVYEIMAYDPDINVYGFDISKYAISNAPDEIRKNVVRSNGLYKRLYPEESFDIIYSFETAEHVSENNVQKWIDNLFAWLKVGGKLFMTICLGHNNIRGLEDNDQSHQTLQTREWWEERIENSGFVKDQESFDKAMLVEVATQEMLERDTPEILMQHYGLHVFAWKKV